VKKEIGNPEYQSFIPLLDINELFISSGGIKPHLKLGKQSKE
jgi:hypothetical protein